MLAAIRVRGRAKVNLFLRVGPRRADGYHDIETVFHAIELADSLVLRRVTGAEISIRCELDVPPEKNLAVRAAKLLREKAGEERVGLSIELEKRIPVAAGLGGGSADAAAVLVGLNALLGAPFEAPALAALGRTLGADVPFCVEGGLAVGTGIGDRLTARPPASFDLVIVKPPVAVSTAWAYQALDAHERAPLRGEADAVPVRLAARGAGALADLAANDFEGVVLPAHPEIARARDGLLAAGARWAMMSGSGSAVFGVFDDGERAQEAARELPRQLPGFEAHATRSAARGAEVVS